MMPVKNMLIRWLGDEASQDQTERILWIDPARQSVFTFDVDDPTALPVQKAYDAIVKALENP